MTLYSSIQNLLFVAIVTILVKPLGGYMERVFSRKRTALDLHHPSRISTLSGALITIVGICLTQPVEIEIVDFGDPRSSLADSARSDTEYRHRDFHLRALSLIAQYSDFCSNASGPLPHTRQSPLRVLARSQGPRINSLTVVPYYHA